MGIEDLPNWADNIELVRLPRIETDIAQSQAVIGNLSSELSARVQEFVDTLIAHNARLNTGQATASTARDLANDALQRLFGNEFAARIYTDNRIQDLRDQVNADLVGVTGQLLPGSPLMEYLDERAGAQAGVVRTDFGPILLGLQSELESIQARVTDAEVLSDELINTVIPAVDVDLAAGALLRDQVQNELNRVMAGFNYETLIEGMDDVREQVWSALDPIGKHVLVSPRADWTLTAHTSAYANPKAPLPEGNLAPAAHARGEHGMFGAGTANQTIGQAVPVNFIPGRFYLLRATVWTESTTTAVSVSLGATTFAGTTAADVGVKRLAATGLLAADGTVELSCIFSSDGEQLEELGYKIGTGTEDEALVLSGSVGADKAFFFVEQNTGGATTGRLRLGKLAVIDITSAIDVVRISRERVQSQFREAEASIETLQATMVTLDSAMAGLGTTLNSRIGNVESNLANNYLTSVQTGTAIAAAETTLNTRVGNVEANLLNNYFTKTETESSMAGYVTQATTQAGLASGSAEESANSASASATSAATATSKAAEAGASAAVASTQANTATTQAGLAATSATQSASSASDAAGSANVASTNASTSAQALGSLQLAMANIPNLIPAPVVESNGFGGNAAGSVIAYSTFAPSFYMTGPDGPFIRRSIAAAIPAVYARALAPMTGDDTKTFRVSIRFTPSVNMDVSLRMAFIRSNGLVSGSIINGPTVAALAGQTITLTAVVGRNAVGMVTLPIGTATNWSESTGIRMGMRSITLDPVAHYDVHEIRVEDLTQAQIATLRSGEADSSANAAATSATNAAASANASAQSATASQSERVAAQTARSGSEIARDDAVGARTVAQGAAGDALNSANAAAGSATTAASSLSLISKVHAGSLIPNGNFNTGDLTLWEGNAIGTTATVLPRGASGSLAYTNAPSPFFLTLAYDTVDRSIEVSQISVEAGELFAWSLRAARSVSGSTAVRVSMVWYGANGLVISASDVPITLNDLVWIAQSGTFTAPALAKTAKLMITKIGGNNPGTPRACFGDIRLTRADPATMALATQTFRTVAQVDSAIATALSTLQATVTGGLTATVTSQQTTIANLNGYAAATAALTATLSDGKIAGIRATVHNGAGGQTNSSVLELLGDQVIAEGTISTNKLNVGLGLNQVVDSEFSAGVSNWQKVGSGPVNDQTFLNVRAPGGTWAGKSYPTLVLNQTGNATGSDVIIANVARLQDGTQQARIMAVSPGDWIEASIKASTHRCVGTLNIQFLTEAGVEINAPSVATFAGNVVSSANNPDAWPLYGGKVQAPANSAYARILVVKGPTTPGQANSLLFVHRPMLAKTTALATELTPYSPPGQTYINGGAMITGSITADKLQVNSLDAISATIGILRTATSGARMEIHSDKILVYDASNMVRVRLGNLV